MSFISKIKYVLVDHERDLWFGFRGDELSIRQKVTAELFDEQRSQWFIDNVGKFGKDWWAELDDQHDSIRAVFKDPSMETWVAMTWCNNQTSEQDE